jgi:hypothetical protein
MTNADRECNSPDAILRHADHPISLTKGRESVRNNAETGFAGHLGSRREPNLPPPSVTRGRFGLFSREPQNVLRQFAPTPDHNRRSLGLPGRGIDAPGGFRSRKAPTD